MRRNDEVKQAYELSGEKKQHALDLYKKSVVELVNQNYKMRADNAHTELSTIFGVDWLFTMRSNGDFLRDMSLYAEANVAFNYANLTLGISGRFVELAKSLVAVDERVDNATLKSMAKQMDSILTATTAEDFESKLSFA